jgi:hypothetical protein
MQINEPAEIVKITTKKRICNLNDGVEKMAGIRSYVHCRTKADDQSARNHTCFAS